VNRYFEPAIRLYYRNLSSKEFKIDNILICLPVTSAKYHLLSSTNKYPNSGRYKRMSNYK
jgi:hypothetical protein